MASTPISENKDFPQKTPDLKNENPSVEETIFVTVINEKGKLYTMSNVRKDINISELMKIAFEMFYKTQKRSVFKFNILSIRSGKILKTFRTLKHNDVQDKDELLLVERYFSHENLMNEAVEEIFTSLKSRSSKTRSEVLSVPNRANIDEVTKKMKTKNKKKRKHLHQKSPHCNPFVAHRELDNTLFTLVEMSTKLVRFNDASVVFDEIVNKVGLHMKPDNVLLNKLISMGYAMDISTIALTLSDNDVQEASEWLASESSTVTAEDIAEFNDLQVNVNNVNIHEDNFSESVMKIMRYLVKKQELYCHIFEEYLNVIKKMGFRDETQIRRALRKSFNDPNRACLVLLGDTIQDTKPVDTTVFVDKIISDPESLVALSDKNMLLGLIDYFADPSDDGTKWYDGRQFDQQLLKIVETFETEKFFSHGCRDNVLMFS